MPYILAIALLRMSSETFAGIGLMSMWQVAGDLYKHLQTVSGPSPIYLKFSDFSCSDLENFH
jgi:hypothetical protein